MSWIWRQAARLDEGASLLRRLSRRLALYSRSSYLQENNSVTELREKIKTFLASQGMIKGHSGSGPRTNEEHPPVLVLVDHLHPSPSSPPTPTLSATSSEGQRPPQHGMNTSFERAPAHYPGMPAPEQQPPHYGQSMYPPTFIPVSW